MRGGIVEKIAVDGIKKELVQLIEVGGEALGFMVPENMDGFRVSRLRVNVRRAGRGENSHALTEIAIPPRRLARIWGKELISFL